MLHTHVQIEHLPTSAADLFVEEVEGGVAFTGRDELRTRAFFPSNSVSSGAQSSKLRDFTSRIEHALSRGRNAVVFMHSDEEKITKNTFCALLRDAFSKVLDGQNYRLELTCTGYDREENEHYIIPSSSDERLHEIPYFRRASSGVLTVRSSMDIDEVADELIKEIGERTEHVISTTESADSRGRKDCIDFAIECQLFTPDRRNIKMDVIILGMRARPPLCGLNIQDSYKYHRAEQSLSSVFALLTAIYCHRLRLPFRKRGVTKYLKSSYTNTDSSGSLYGSDTFLHIKVNATGNEENVYRVLCATNLARATPVTGFITTDLNLEIALLQRDTKELKKELYLFHEVHKDEALNLARTVESRQAVSEEALLEYLLAEKEEKRVYEQLMLESGAKDEASKSFEKENEFVGLKLHDLENAIRERRHNNEYLRKTFNSVKHDCSTTESDALSRTSKLLDQIKFERKQKRNYLAKCEKVQNHINSISSRVEEENGRLQKLQQLLSSDLDETALKQNSVERKRQDILSMLEKFESKVKNFDVRERLKNNSISGLRKYMEDIQSDIQKLQKLREKLQDADVLLSSSLRSESKFCKDASKRHLKWTKKITHGLNSNKLK